MKKKFIYNLFLTFLCLVLLFFFLQHREQYFIIFLSLTCSLSFLPSSSLSQFFLHSLSNLLERGQLVQHTNNIHISNTPKNVNTCVHTLHMVPKCVYYLLDVIIFLSTILLMCHEMYTLVLISSSDHGMNVKARTKNKGTQARPTIQTR